MYSKTFIKQLQDLLQQLSKKLDDHAKETGDDYMVGFVVTSFLCPAVTCVTFLYHGEEEWHEFVAWDINKITDKQFLKALKHFIDHDLYKSVLKEEGL
jgi:hypothetical protein